MSFLKLQQDQPTQVIILAMPSNPTESEFAGRKVLQWYYEVAIGNIQYTFACAEYVHRKLSMFPKLSEVILTKKFNAGKYFIDVEPVDGTKTVSKATKQTIKKIEAKNDETVLGKCRTLFLLEMYKKGLPDNDDTVKLANRWANAAISGIFSEPGIEEPNWTPEDLPIDNQ